MTEMEWRECTDVGSMLSFPRYTISNRRLRLFACACARQSWHLLYAECYRQAILLAESFADEQVPWERLGEISDECWRRLRDPPRDRRHLALAAARTALATLHGYAPEAAAGAAWEAIKPLARRSGGGQDRTKDLATAGAPLADVLREILGPRPQRPFVVPPAWFRWNRMAIPGLAREIYDCRAFENLPILADALEEAGCDNAEILTHCRGGGEHVRGCWVVDLLLAKS